MLPSSTKKQMLSVKCPHCTQESTVISVWIKAGFPCPHCQKDIPAVDVLRDRTIENGLPDISPKTSSSSTKSRSERHKAGRLNPRLATWLNRVLSYCKKLPRQLLRTNHLLAVVKRVFDSLVLWFPVPAVLLFIFVFHYLLTSAHSYPEPSLPLKPVVHEQQQPAAKPEQRQPKAIVEQDQEPVELPRPEEPKPQPPRPTHTTVSKEQAKSFLKTLLKYRTHRTHNNGFSMDSLGEFDGDTLELYSTISKKNDSQVFVTKRVDLRRLDSETVRLIITNDEKDYLLCVDTIDDEKRVVTTSATFGKETKTHTGQWLWHHLPSDERRAQHVTKLLKHIIKLAQVSPGERFEPGIHTTIAQFESSFTTPSNPLADIPVNRPTRGAYVQTWQSDWDDRGDYYIDATVKIVRSGSYTVKAETSGWTITGLAEKKRTRAVTGDTGDQLSIRIYIPPAVGGRKKVRCYVID